MNMMKNIIKSALLLCFSGALVACGGETTTDIDKDTGTANQVVLDPQPAPEGNYPKTRSGEPLLGNIHYPAISYGAFRTTERTEANVPTVAELKEDLRLMQAMGIKLLRTYNTQGFSDTANLLIAIDELMAEDENFEMYVMLGIWIDALNSWTGNPIDPTQNNPANYAEVAKAVEMVNDYPEIIKVLAVGNEAMVHWAPYHVSPAIILEHVNTLRTKRDAGEIPADVWITSSDNFASWSGLGDYNVPELADLVNAVDYVSVHSYPFHDTHYNNQFWLVPEQEQSLDSIEQVDAAMLRAQQHLLSQVKQVQEYLKSQGVTKQIHIGETGWASETNFMYGDEGSKAADEYKQKAFFNLMRSWSEEFGASLFFFQAFDEPWKGDQNNPGDSEKHFGLIDIDGNAKYAIWDLVDQGVFDGLTRGGMSIFKSHGGIEQNVLDSVLAPNPQPVIDTPTNAEQFVVLDTGLFTGAETIAWEGTSYLAEENGVLTLTTAPTAGEAKDWGWGAGVVLAGQAGANLTGFENGTLSFDIKGTTASVINIGFQTGIYGDNGRPQTNNSVAFGPGGRAITGDWVSHTIDISELISGNPDFADVTSPFYFQGSADIDGGVVEIRNIVFRK
ncbi:hypothetical protein [Vibrio sp.]|uniref:hypothetical protein n=1 Tax=Vibrio sp. TaxID=678 RepID=UPI003D10074F